MISLIPEKKGKANYVLQSTFNISSMCFIIFHNSPEKIRLFESIFYIHIYPKIHPKVNAL